MVRRGLVLVTAAALLVACSSSSRARPAPSTTAVATSTTTVAPAAVPPGVRAMLLRPADLPAGWRALGDATATSVDASQSRLCPDLARSRRALARAGARQVASVAFAQGASGAPLVLAKVWVAPDVTVADRVFALLLSRAYITCAGRAAGGNHTAAPRVSPVAVPRVGDDAAGMQAVVVSTSNGATFETRINVAAVRTGRFVSELVFVDADLLPIAPATRNAAIRAAARRAQAAASRSSS